MADGTNSRFDFSAPVPHLAELGPVHLIAIGGAGMSGVARLLLEHGLTVSGSDARPSRAVAELSALGARVSLGHDPANLGDAATVVVSSAIREDNVELVAARAAGLRVLHRAQALAACLDGARPVAVAGANGKTTTTSMVTVALRAAGADPSFASGGVLPGLDTNAHRGGGDVFVVEADESDGSFLTYHPEVAVVTNVQPDHLDFYGTFAQVQRAYADFAASRRPGGVLVACHDDPGSRALADTVAAAGGQVVTYGFAAGADVRLDAATEAVAVGAGFGAHATLHVRDGGPRRLVVATPGRHNLLNAAAAYAVCVPVLGEPADAVLEGLATFSGARRRFEVAGRVDGITVVDDYAHNPGKVTALMRTAVALVGAEHVRVVFQPHLYSRTRDFAAGFGAALALAGDVTVLEIYGAREDPVAGVTSELVAAEVRRANPGARVEVGPDLATLPAALADRSRPGDLLLTVGAGDVTALAPRLVAALAGRA